MKVILVAAVALSLTLLGGDPLLAQSGHELFQQALVKERAEGDVQGAIELYRRIVREFVGDRPLAAKALVQMGICYEKLGLTEAQQAYRQVIEDFPEQEEEVAVARERLVDLTRALAELEPDASFRKIRIPSNPENGVLSPDGARLAFASGGSLWVLPLQGMAAPDVAGEPVRLTEPMDAWNDGNVAAWSADGRWIAFNAAVGGVDRVYVVPSAGGALTHVPVEREPVVHYSQLRLSLSPDGTTLAYSAADREAPEVVPGRPPVDLYTVPVGGGTPTRLTQGGASWSGHASFSPDGRFVAYVNAVPGGRSQEWQVWVVPQDGGTPVRISDVAGMARSPVWSPDGRHLAFSYLKGPGSDSEEVWVVPMSGDGTAAGDPVKIRLPLVNIDMLAGWTADDELGIFLKNPRQAAIYTVPVAGGHATQITTELTAAWHPRWSPDGKRIFFNAPYRVPGGEYRTQISWVPSSGGAITRLPMTADPPVVPAATPGGGYGLSPDGSRIVFFGYRQVVPVTGNIWTIPVEGGEPTQLTTAPVQDRFPCWSPDGSSVAFLRYRERSAGEYVANIHVVAAAGGEPVQLTTDAHRVAWATIRYSPDGEWMAYFSEDSTLNVLPLEGGEPKALTEVPRHDEHLEMAWSPDGRRIAYTGQGSIWVVEVQSGKSTELMTGVLTKESQEVYIDWSPDGTKIVFSAATGDDRELWMIRDFLPQDGT